MSHQCLWIYYLELDGYSSVLRLHPKNGCIHVYVHVYASMLAKLIELRSFPKACMMNVNQLP